MPPLMLVIDPKGKYAGGERTLKTPEFEGGHFSDGFNPFFWYLCSGVRAHTLIITGLTFEHTHNHSAIGTYIISWLKMKYVKSH